MGDPITEVHGQPLHGMTMEVRTEVAVARMAGGTAGKSDLTAVSIVPTPAQQWVLDGHALPWPDGGGVIQLAISRSREYQADADGALLSGDPSLSPPPCTRSNMGHKRCSCPPNPAHQEP